MAGNEFHVERGLGVEGSHTADKLGKACRTPCLRCCVHTEPLAWDTSCLALGLSGTDVLTDHSLVNDGLEESIPCCPYLKENGRLHIELLQSWNSV